MNKEELFNTVLSKHLVDYVTKNGHSLFPYYNVKYIIYNFDKNLLYFMFDNSDDRVIVTRIGYHYIYDEFYAFVKCSSCKYKELGYCNKIEICDQYIENEIHDEMLTEILKKKKIYDTENIEFEEAYNEPF